MTVLDFTMGKALEELNTIMEEREIPPVKLHVIGGFAMMLHGFRNPAGITDIDYVGSPAGEAFLNIAASIGEKYRLGRDWINRDVMLSGISLEDFEKASGKLHFKQALSLSKLEISALIPEDLLRMKVIAIDTALTAVEFGGDFTRQKDFPDVFRLMETLGKDIDTVCSEFDSYIECTLTKEALKTYKKDPANLGRLIEDKQHEAALIASISKMERQHDTKGLEIVQQMLSRAMQRVREEYDEKESE